VTEEKGVFDTLEMAHRLERERPSAVHWDICGSGPDLEALKRRQRELGLENVVTLHGFTQPEALRELLARAHVSIVPTRSTFKEGMAQTVVESILVGRPVITCSVVPALEVCRAACLEAVTNDVGSYVDRVKELMDDPALYARLCAATRDLAAPFYDPSFAFAAALERSLSPLMSDRSRR
jgi:glycosyltransferase involved in cell wall biosynthesis